MPCSLVQLLITKVLAKKDEIVEGKAETHKKTIFQISKLGYVENGIMLQDILDSKEMIDAY